jgi:hypothetical protein
MIRKFTTGVFAESEVIPSTSTVNVLVSTADTPTLYGQFGCSNVPAVVAIDVTIIIELGLTIDDVTTQEVTVALPLGAGSVSWPQEAPPIFGVAFAPPTIQDFVLILSDCPEPPWVIAVANEIPVDISTR